MTNLAFAIPRWPVARSVAMAVALVAAATAAPAQPTTTTARAGWRVGGFVISLARLGNVLYLAGNFRGIAPERNASGNMITVDAVSGAIVPFPGIDRQILAEEPDGAGGWFIAGDIADVVDGASQPRTRLAHILANGHLDTAWAPEAVGGRVRALRLVPGIGLFVGGDFTTLSGQARHRVGLLDPATGAVLSWTYDVAGGANTVHALAYDGDTLFIGGGFSTVDGLARANLAAVSAIAVGQVGASLGVDAQVEALHVSSPGTFYVGGSFTSAGGQVRSRLARFSHAAASLTATLDPWNPGASNVVRAFASSGTSVFAGGDFTTIGSQARSRVAEVDGAGAATAFNPSPNGPVYGLARSGSTLYVVGLFDQLGTTWRNAAAAVDLPSSRVLPWNPSPVGTTFAVAVNGATIGLAGQLTGYGAVPRTHLAALDLQTGDILPWAPRLSPTSSGVQAIVLQGTTLYFGGDFTDVNGEARGRLAAVDATTGTLLPWNPNADEAVLTIALDGTSAYVGGNFTTVGGQPRTRLARVRLSDGAVDPAFVASANNRVWHVVLGAGRAYAGGDFTTVNGAAAPRIVALDSATGATLPAFAASTSDEVYRMSYDSGYLYAAGSFLTANGQPRQMLAKFDGATGALQAWAPTLAFGPRAQVLTPNGLGPNDVEAVGDTVLISGAFEFVGGQQRLGLAAVDAVTGAPTSWAPQLGTLSGGNGSEILVGPDITIVGGGRIQLADELQNGLAIFVEPQAQRPLPPTNFTASVAGNTVSLDWRPSPLGLTSTGYVLEAGAAAGTSNIARLNLGPTPQFSTGNVPPGTYYLRVRSVTALGTSGPTADLALTVGASGCTAPPQPPTDGIVTVNGSTVSITWTQPSGPAPDGYVLTAGTGPGLTNIATINVGNTTAYSVPGVPPGAYYLRASATNACGASVPSAEFVANVGGVPQVPLAPLALSGSSTGGTVTLTWTAPPISTVTGYRLEAGRSAGASDIAVFDLGFTTFSTAGVPPGVYYVRVRALNTVGASAPSNELILVVP